MVEVSSRNRILGILFMVAAIAMNEWVLGALLSPSGRITTSLIRFFIIFFEIIVFAGGIALFRGGTNSFGRYCLSLVYILLIVLSIEAGLHVMTKTLGLDVKNDYSEKVRHQGGEWESDYWKEYARAARFDFKPLIGWRRLKYSGKYININDEGLRKTLSPDGGNDGSSGQIFFFGGSTVWGYGARDSHTIPSYVAAMLKDRGYSFRVVNYGEDAYTFRQDIARLLELLSEGKIPDYVVFYDGVNDVLAAYQAGNQSDVMNFNAFNEMFERAKLRPFQKMVDNFLIMIRENSLIYKALARVVPSLKEEAISYSDDDAFRLGSRVALEYAINAEFLNKLADSYGFKYIAYWQPVIYTEEGLVSDENKLHDIDPMTDRKDLEIMYHAARNSVESMRIERFYDISDVLKDRNEPYYIDFCHLSESGNEVVAKRITEDFMRDFLTRK